MIFTSSISPFLIDIIVKNGHLPNLLVTGAFIPSEVVVGIAILMIFSTIFFSHFFI